MRLHSLLVGALGALLLTITGCGSDDDGRPRPTATATVAAATATRTAVPTGTPSVAPATATATATATASPIAPTATATSIPSTATATATGTTGDPTPTATATEIAPTSTATLVPSTPTHTGTPTASPSPTTTIDVDALSILSPADGAVITTSTVDIRAQVTQFVPDEVSADLNGTTVGLPAGSTAGIFETTVGPGAPLQEQNTLVVTARRGTTEISRSVQFTYQPPKSLARRISDPGDLISGPLADGQIGDYLLANSVARFIIQDVAQRDLYSVGTYGGNIIDVELVGRPGLDNFLEIQPAVQVETVINAQTIEIVNDGQDGRPAVIRTCGPDDVLDFVNPSTIIEDIGGLSFPASADDANFDVEGCTEYRLPPDKPYIEMVTTIYNNGDETLGLFVGDYINAAGQLEQWTSSGVGLGEVLTNNLGVMSFIGFGEATGVDYAHTTLPVPGSSIPGSSFFTASGVSYIMQSNSVIGVIFGGPPTFFVPAGGSNSYTRYFAVGDGSGSNAIDLELEVKQAPVGALRGCVTAGGAPLPAARVSVGPISATDPNAIASVTTVFVTDDAGCYTGTLSPGSYGVAAGRHGVPYEGNGATPLVHPIAIAAGTAAVQDIALPAPGRVRVAVTDENGAAVPARVSIVGIDPSPEVLFPGSDVTGLFYDQKEAFPFGYVHLAYTGADGVAEFGVEPGSYQLAVSRGVEYSLFEQLITVAPGPAVEVAAQIARVIDTTGFVSSDFHVHGIASADSRVPNNDRVRQFAGEGVDNIIMTDHHAHTDLTPTIGALGFTDFVRSTIGEEITTWDYGHFNAYPLLIDPSRATGGSTDWAVAAEPGQEFKSLGAFSAPPAEIEQLAIDGPLSTPDTTIQINHIDSFFDPLEIDTAVVPPQSFINATNKLRYRLDPNSGNLFHPFKALEVWNGSSRGAQREFLDRRIGIWFNLLNQGIVTTAIGDTDTHEFLPLGAAGARTWTAASTDDPASIDPGEVARAVDAGRATAGQGVYVQARLVADDGSEAAADLTAGGSTSVSSSTGKVRLEVNAQAPLWAPFDRIEIYANAETVVAVTRNGTPTLYGAEPSLVLVAGQDVPLVRATVVPSVPGAERWESIFSVPFELTEDTWFVVMVRGTDGVSRPMFPVIASGLSAASNQTLEQLIDGNLGEGGVLALGFTNALYADVDGEPGFQAPRRPQQ